MHHESKWFVIVINKIRNGLKWFSVAPFQYFVMSPFSINRWWFCILSRINLGVILPFLSGMWKPHLIRNEYTSLVKSLLSFWEYSIKFLWKVDFFCAHEEKMGMKIEDTAHFLSQFSNRYYHLLLSWYDKPKKGDLFFTHPVEKRMINIELCLWK